jgi:2-polyprenyl-6-methoxyphenol hydroxylase-like FAD-dependent oxidoreductase
MTRAAAQRSDVIVVGGGFGGLVTAAAVERRGLRVTVLESLQGPIEALRGELLHAPGVRALEQLDMLDALREAGAIEVRGFAAVAQPGADAVLLPYSSGYGLGLEHQLLVLALRRALLRNPLVRLVTGARVEAPLFEDGRVCGVRRGDGVEERAGVVIAADGRHSRMRQALGIDTDVALLSYTLGVPLASDVLPHRGHGHVFLGAPGPILAYPYGAGRVRMNVDVPLSAPHGRDALAEYVSAEYAPFVPEPLRASMLEALAARSFTACANHAISTESCAVPGAALVGDAGGCSHPLTATGMTSTLHDATTLADALDTYGPCDQALLTYQRRRYKFVRAREVFAHALYEVFRGADEGALALRQGVFRYWDDERSRRASMAILAGDDSSVVNFATEYARVVATSFWDVLWTKARAKQPLDARRPMVALFGTARECLEVALRKAWSARVSEQTFELRRAG